VDFVTLGLHSGSFSNLNYRRFHPLKIRIATLSLTILCLALSVPAFAGYSNGPTLGTLNAYFIDGPNGPFGQTISDGFIEVGTGNAISYSFAEWVLAGDTPTGVDWSLGSTSFGNNLGFGHTFIDSTNSSVFCLNGQGSCGGGFGYDVYIVTGTLNGASLADLGQYYFTLTNATDNRGDGFNGWDVNEGPATCYFQNASGSGGCPTTESESFTINTGGGTTPEPSSIMLFGSGILGLAGVLRRKLTR
jgi:hypothetical protein